jgi:hypothetical protein
MLSMVQTYRLSVCLPSLKDRIAFRHAGLPRPSCEFVGLRDGKSDWQGATNGQISVELNARVRMGRAKGVYSLN